MSLYVWLFFASVIALGGCILFTNGIEWLGKRLKVSEGAIGSIFAAVGTALPESTIPVIAIFFGTGQEQTDVGLGAILGAPFMLSTLALPILAGLLVLCAKMGKRKSAFVLDYQEVRIDLIFFLIAYGLALTCVFASIPTTRYGVAILLIVLYLAYMKLKFSSEQQGSSVLAPLILARRSTVPSSAMIGRQVAIGLIGLVGGRIYLSPPSSRYRPNWRSPHYWWLCLSHRWPRNCRKC
jgi:cation:H+ antiporter